MAAILPNLYNDSTSNKITISNIVLDDIVKRQLNTSLADYLFQPATASNISSALNTANNIVNNYFSTPSATSTDIVEATTKTTTRASQLKKYWYDRVEFDTTTSAVNLHQSTSTRRLWTDYWRTSDYTMATTFTDYSITYTNDDSSYIDFYDYIRFDSNGVHIKTARNQFKEKIKSGLLIRIKSRVDFVQNAPENEQIAIESLRETISESEFRKYIKYGFVLVKGQSGDVYQVFRNKSHTKVWRGGQVIEEICVRLNSDAKAPPTDNVIAFKTMIEANEEEFKKCGNVYKLQKAA